MSDIQEKIKQRAYSLYLERGRRPGHEVEDWIEAEREVLAEQKKHSPAGPEKEKILQMKVPPKPSAKETPLPQEQRFERKSAKSQHDASSSMGKYSSASSM